MYRVGYVGCALIALGVFLPYKHVLYRDVNAFATYGAVMLVLAVIAAVMIRNGRARGASFCAIAVLFLLALDYMAMAKANALASAFMRTIAGGIGNVLQNEKFAGPLGLDVHANVGFYIIALGALLVAFAPAFARRNRTLSS